MPVPPAKRFKANSGKAVSGSHSVANDVDDDDDDSTSKTEVGKKRKLSQLNSSAPASYGNGNGSSKAKKEPFRRVRAEEIEITKTALKDNSYKSFDTWGAKANQDLIVTRGKGFRSEKTKKKRGSYRGGAINVGVNSIRFDDSD